MLKCVETMQKINMQCDPIALAKRYTQCAPINLALCPTAIHSKSHPTVRHSKPRPTVRHSKPPPPLATTLVSGELLTHRVALDILDALAKFTRT